MARIPDDQLDRLKQGISLQRLAEGMGITLKRHGAECRDARDAKRDIQVTLSHSPVATSY